MDVQPVWNVKPEWEIVNTSFENVDVEKNAKPIRVAEESYNNIEYKGSKVREENTVEILEEMDVENPDKKAEKVREQNKKETDDKDKDNGGICACFIF